MLCTQFGTVNTQASSAPCSWCNETSSCHSAKALTKCPVKGLNTCPNNAKDVSGEISAFTANSSGGADSSTIVIGAGGAVAFGMVIAGGLILAQRRHLKNTFDASIWANTAVTNPLYQDRTMKFENPLYRNPDAVEDE